MNGHYLGELAALGTSLCFTAGSVFFTLASRQVGALALNRMRLPLALLFLTMAHLAFLGTPFPLEAGAERWLWLGASGVIGLGFGDVFLLQAFGWIGPRLTLMMLSLSPILSTLLAWVALGERINAVQMLGIAATIGGIIWVVLEKNGNSGEAVQQGRYLPGLISGLIASICQASALVLARQGLGGGFSPISANLMRMTAAAAAIWLLTLAQRQARQTFKTLRDHTTAGRNILVGSFMGPFMGVSLTMLALQHTEVGIVSTLISLPTIFLLPVSYMVFKERYGWGVVAGTLLAIAGSALLFLM